MKNFFTYFLYISFFIYPFAVQSQQANDTDRDEKYCEFKTDNGYYKGSCKLNQDKKVPNGLGIYYNNDVGTVILGHFQDNGKNSMLDGGLGIVISYKYPISDAIHSYKEGKIKNTLNTCSLSNMKLEELKKQDIIEVSAKEFVFKHPYRCLINYLLSEEEIKSNEFYRGYPVDKWKNLMEEEKIVFMNMLIQTLNIYIENRSNIKNNFNDYLENNYAKFDLDKIIKIKNSNIIKYEKEYLKKDISISIPKSRLIFKKIEKINRTIYGASLFGWGYDSYNECISIRYDDVRKGLGTCKERQVSHFDIFFKDKLQNLDIVCTNVNSNRPESHFNNITELRVGDSVAIYNSIFFGIYDKGHILLSECWGGHY